MYARGPIFSNSIIVNIWKAWYFHKWTCYFYTDMLIHFHINSNLSNTFKCPRGDSLHQVKFSNTFRLVLNIGWILRFHMRTELHKLFFLQFAWGPKFCSQISVATKKSVLPLTLEVFERPGIVHGARNWKCPNMPFKTNRKKWSKTTRIFL